MRRCKGTHQSTLRAPIGACRPANEHPLKLCRLPEYEETAPVRRGDYWYYRRRGPGDDYWTSLRRPAAQGSAAAGELDDMDPSQEEQVLSL